MSLDILEKVIQEDTIPLEVAEKYLNIFLGPTDWKKNINKLWEISGSKSKDVDSRKAFMKRAISCAALLPYTEKSQVPSPPENLLFWCTAWVQFNEKDWFDIFKKVVKEDIDIAKNRNKAILLGVIDPIDISPLGRQAFNWLYEKARENEDLDTLNVEGLKIKLSNIVKSYGGAVVCNMFVNHKKNVNNVFNWRSGYFFEREIHKVYSLQDILKIKNTEIEKTNSKYIKKISN
jgi:hypothetical protein